MKIANVSGRLVVVTDDGGIDVETASAGRFGSGPWLVRPDELGDRDDLELGCSVDGCQVQKSRTSQLICGVPELIARLSAVLPLLPGDLIFTGTPAGIGATRQPPHFLRPGQVLNSYIEGVSTMANRLIAPPG